MDNNNFNFPENYQNKKRGPLSNLPPMVFIFLSLSAVFFLYQIIGGLISYYLLGSDLEIKDDNVNITRLILIFAQFMFILFPAVVLVMLQGNNLKETFRLRKPKMSVFLFAVIGIIAIQPFLQVFLYYQNEIIFSLPFGKEIITKLKDLFDMLESSMQKLVIAKSFTEFILIVIVIAVTPAICEEFLFRGLVFKNFENIIPASKAIFFTGLLFALFHFHPFNLIPLTVLGIFLTYIVYHSGSIYTAVFCHFLNNFMSALAVYVFGADSTEAGKTESMDSTEQIQFILLGIISASAFVLIIKLIKKYSVIKNNSDNLSEMENEQPE